MSRFESSRFVRNPQVMHVDVLKSACDALGWMYAINGNELLVTDAKQGTRLYGEFALKLNLTTNEVTYNTYYMPNAKHKVEELQNQFYALNAAYAKNSLVQAFKKKGFTYKSNDHFTPTTEEVYCFFMVTMMSSVRFSSRSPSELILPVMVLPAEEMVRVSFSKV